MSVQAIQLELIKKIARIEDEQLLERLQQFLQQVEQEEKLVPPPPALSEIETTLLLKINEGLPEDVLRRYLELSVKSVQENLTPAEHEELLQLIPQVEARTAERLRYLIELANLWEISLDELMERLGIHPPPVMHG